MSFGGASKLFRRQERGFFAPLFAPLEGRRKQGRRKNVPSVTTASSPPGASPTFSFSATAKTRSLTSASGRGANRNRVQRLCRAGMILDA